jgi:uncharacterized protein (TIGR02996 family)
VPLYELDAGASRKFFRIELEGTRVHLHWGPIGSEGEHQFLSHDNAAQARAEYERQLAKRARAGYSLVVDEAAARDPEARDRARLAQTGPLSEDPRFLMVHPGGRRFAWVEARGDTLIRADGVLVDGMPGAADPTVEACGSPAAALARREAVIEELAKRGFELDTFGVKEPRKPRPRNRRALRANLELEDVIADDPDDEQRWLVLEDWLLEQDDPLAELVQLEKTASEGDAALARGKLLPRLLGHGHAAIAAALRQPDWRAGLLCECGFEVPPGKGIDLFWSFLRAPAARLLRRLTVVIEHAVHMVHICTSITDAACARTVRRLELSARTRSSLSSELAAGVLAPLRGLEVLLIENPGIRVTEIGRLPRLKTLMLPYDQDHALRWFVDEHLPALTSLALQLEDLPADTDLPRILRPLLAGKTAPVLDTLAIQCDPEVGRALVDTLRASPLLSQLRVLALGTEAVIPQRVPGFGHLQTLLLPDEQPG